MKVRIYEVFTSVEGEGILYGTKTLFVRLAGCPFGCSYCDTGDALPADSGTEYGIEEARRLIDSSMAPNTYKVNFTGGDPLVQHEAVAELARHVREGGTRTYLESSCFDSGRFAHVLPHIDIAKVEIKTSDSGFAREGSHERLVSEALECLRLSLAAGKSTYVKIVAGAGTSPDELGSLAGRVSDIAGEGLEGFVIQPVYGEGEPQLDHVMALYDAVCPSYPDVRVVPQLHKLIGAP